MQITEYVSLGHPDKVADYISCYLLDRYIEKDPATRYAVEVQIKGNNVTLAGEVSSKAKFTKKQIAKFVQEAVCEIGYDKAYQKKWGAKNTICGEKLNVFQFIGQQSPDIARGLKGWGDQGIFFGAAWPTDSYFPYAKDVAELIGKDLFGEEKLGKDIKTLVVADSTERIRKIIVAVPALEQKDIQESKTLSCLKELHVLPCEVIINGTGEFKQHGPVADCGTTGRKLAVDFYGGFCRIGGGSPWTKDGSKADLTLNIYARYLAVQYIKKNKRTGPVFCDIACCIGKREIEICLHDGKGHIIDRYTEKKAPQELIKKFKLNTPIYAKLCRDGLFSEVDDAK